LGGFKVSKHHPKRGEMHDEYWLHQVFYSFINLFFVINFGGTFITDPDDQQDVAVFLHLSSE